VKCNCKIHNRDGRCREKSPTSTAWLCGAKVLKIIGFWCRKNWLIVDCTAIDDVPFKGQYYGSLKKFPTTSVYVCCFLSSLVFLLSWFSQGHKFLNYAIIFIDFILLIQRNVNFKNDINLIKGQIFIYFEKRKVWKLPWASLKKRKKRPSKFLKNREAVLSISTLVQVPCIFFLTQPICVHCSS